MRLTTYKNLAATLWIVYFNSDLHHDNIDLLLLLTDLLVSDHLEMVCLALVVAPLGQGQGGARQPQLNGGNL